MNRVMTGRITFALLIVVIIDVCAIMTGYYVKSSGLKLAGISTGSTHFVMGALALIAIAVFSKGNWDQYGFTTGTFTVTPRFFLWVLPTACLSTIGFFADRESNESPFQFTPFQTILFVWIIASIMEEILTRGFLQSYLEPLRQYGISLRSLRLSLPVIISGTFFGAMHIIAIPILGPPVVVFTTILGLIAAYYREKTGSLIPAIGIHMMFNIGGNLPGWILNTLL